MIIISLLILLLSITIGFNITNKVSIHILPEVKWAWIISIGSILSSIVFFISFKFLGVDNGAYSGIALQLITIIFTTELKNYQKLWLIKENGLKIFKNKPLLILLGVLGVMLFTLFNTHIIQQKSDGLYTGESTYGDLPFHLTTISQLAIGKTFPPQNPFYAGLPLVYPYLINLYSSLFVFYGLDLRLSIIIPGMLLGTSLIALIYEFSYTITKKRYVSILATLLYFLQGGTGFYYFLKDNAFNLFQIFSTLQSPSTMIEYSHLFRENIQWGNFLTRMIVPERSILFGIPAGIIILRILFFRGNDSKISKFEMALSAILLGFMPLLHTHTVLAFLIILPILSLFTFYKKKNASYIKSLFTVAFFTVLIALPILPTFFGHLGNTESFFKLHFGWMTETDKESFLFFWFKNTYLYIPCSLFILLMPKKFNTDTKIIQFSALVVFITLNLALFSPYNWDNVKFLFWAGLFWTIATALVIEYLFLNLGKKWVALPLAIIIITLIGSASLSYYREINLQYMLFSKEDREVESFVKQNTKNDALILTETIHNSPVSNLAGRQITMGYPGSLWVHGIKYGRRESQVKDIFSGSTQANDSINELGINYAIVPKYESEMKPNIQFFNQYPKVFENKNYLIFELNK